jgi:hypothetical protein
MAGLVPAIYDLCRITENVDARDRLGMTSLRRGQQSHHQCKMRRTLPSAAFAP